MIAFREIARDVYVLRYPTFDVNVTLIVGGGEALLVDTLSTSAQATELAVEARKLTEYPRAIVNTHHHFDHCLGNATLADPGRPIWAHEETALLLREQTEQLRRAWYEECAAHDPALADEVAGTPIQAPTRTVHLRAALEVGGRSVVLHHFGRGHTAGDLIVQVPDADVVIAGDLVEESGPPSFADAFPLEWPGTLAGLLRLTSRSTVVVPGHGALVGRDFVTRQHADLVKLEWLIREGDYNGSPADEVATRAPFDRATALTAVQRGYETLSR